MMKASYPAPTRPVTDDDLDLLVIAIQALRPAPDLSRHDLAAVDRGREILRKWLEARGMADDSKTPAVAAPPDWRGLCADLADELDAETGYTTSDGKRITHVDVARARAALAESVGEQPAPPTEGEVGELVAELRMMASQAAEACQFTDAESLSRAADLLEQRHLTPVSAGMIPVEYWDIDSGARIVSEPSEDGPGGCWVVLNSRLVNPFTEFPTAEAAWDALQAAHALPLPQGEVEE